jgi:transposase
MRYSRAIKESVIKKAMPPENRSISQLSKEYGISEQTIRNWMEKVKSGTLDLSQDEIGPRFLSSSEKLQLILESASLSEEEKGSWIREKGLHSQHLELWEQELRDIVTEKQKNNQDELKAAKKRIKELQKEVSRKDKALAEMAALIALKKKLETVFGDDEDD